MRAVHFAQAHGRQLVWCTAYDVPLTRDDETRSQESLRASRRRWLTYTESKTDGVCGILPLCVGLPIRFTDTVAFEYGACKHAAAALVGWATDEDLGAAAEVALTKLPACLFVRFPGAEWTIDEKLGVGVLPVYQKTCYWDRAPGASVRRTGFPIVPNLGGTAHSFTGTTLKSAILDLLDPTRTPRFDDVPKSYVGISRIRNILHLLLAQPLAPCLFRMGPQPGPSLLLRWLEGNMSEDELEQEWKRASSDTERKKTIRRLADVKLPCAVCSKEKTVAEYAVEPPPGASGQWYPAWTLIEAGAWRRCKACSDVTAQRSAQRRLMPQDLVCFTCGMTKPCSNFDNQSVIALHEADQVFRAICLVCDPSTLRTELRDGEEAYACARCNERLPASAFDITWFKKHQKGWTCIACQDDRLRPPCDKCRQRPQNRLPYPPEVYRCDACRYPPCVQCKVAERPRNGRYSTTVVGMETWTCAKCQSMLLQCAGTCQLLKDRGSFSLTQLELGDARVCKLCIVKQADKQAEEDCAKHQRLRCRGPCRRMKDRDSFSLTQLKLGDARVCELCIVKQADKQAKEDSAKNQRLRCRGPCRRMKDRGFFSKTQLDRGENRICGECIQKHLLNMLCGVTPPPPVLGWCRLWTAFAGGWQHSANRNVEADVLRNCFIRKVGKVQNGAKVDQKDALLRKGCKKGTKERQKRTKREPKEAKGRQK